MDDLPLFSSGDSSDEGDEASAPSTWGVLELNQAIEGALAAAFPDEIWVRGEIQGLSRTRMRKHWYFELIEKDDASDQVKARVSVNLLQWNRGAVDRELRRHPGLQLDDDVEVRIRCRVGYFPPWGRLQLAMTGIDPEFTLGQMAANRERILRALSAEGLLDRNARHALARVPRRIGLVTSVGSAAYNDFVQEIQRGGLALHVLACDARVQGADTERTVIAALRTLVRRGCDVIVLARGGGSRSDLAGFDSEAIARTIAACPVPVLTGIGHEIDTSVADAVAHTSFKTPTAVAAFLVESARRTVEEIESAWAAIVDRARERLEERTAELSRMARESSRSARDTLRHRERDLAEHRRTLRRESHASLERAHTRWSGASRGVRSLVQLRLAERQAQLGSLRRSLGAERLRRLLHRRERQLAERAQRLVRAARRAPAPHERRLEALDTQVRALDPRHVLRRGFSITTDAEGRLVRDAAHLSPGEVLHTQLGRGQVLSHVESVQNDPESGPGADQETSAR